MVFIVRLLYTSIHSVGNSVYLFPNWFKILIFFNVLGTGIVTQLCAPSVTPWRYKIPGTIGPAHNPSFRLLKYDRSTSNLLDFTQYYMDLPEVNMNNKSEWKIEYNATSVYSLSDLSSASMASLVRRMKNPIGREFQSFYRFWTVSVDPEYQESCDKTCHARIYCNFRYLKTDEFGACINETLLPTSNSQHTQISAILLHCWQLLLCSYFKMILWFVHSYM